VGTSLRSFAHPTKLDLAGIERRHHCLSRTPE